jgi:hypothetical protein
MEKITNAKKEYWRKLVTDPDVSSRRLWISLNHSIHSLNKSSPQDIFPTWVLKRSLPVILPAITLIVNRSLECGMPVKFKHATITPIYKKSCNDTNSFSSYRPVSNLPFLSKVIERVFSQRISTYLTENSLNDPHQFAYGKKPVM